GNLYDYGFRVYNPRIGRFLSIDPLESGYPWYTPYQFAGNMPIWAIDLDGLEPVETSSIDQLTTLVPVLGPTQPLSRSAVTPAGEIITENIGKIGGKIFGIGSGVVIGLLTTTSTAGEGEDEVFRKLMAGEPVKGWSYPQKKDDEPDLVYRGGSRTDANF